jgi:hypothetical protein
MSPSVLLNIAAAAVLAQDVLRLTYLSECCVQQALSPLQGRVLCLAKAQLGQAALRATDH